MGLAQMQAALARLYTDNALRERFVAAPEAVGAEFGLSREEAQQLAEQCAPQIDRFAASLHSKRWNEIVKLFPLTHRVLGAGLLRFFRCYADTYVPQGIKKHREDAIAFAEFVGRTATLEEGEPWWALELLRYEKASLLLRGENCRWHLCRFRCAVDQLAQVLLTRQEEPPAPSSQVRILFWFRLTRRGRLRRVALTLPIPPR